MAVLLSGCSTVRTLPPAGLEAAGRVTVFTDGFHSGLVAERGELPPDLDPQHDDSLAQLPYQTLHFGERRWTLGEDESLLHALSLAVIPGEGVIQTDRCAGELRELDTLDHAHLRFWSFPTSQAGLDRLNQQLRQEWMGPPLLIRHRGDNSTVRMAGRRWSLFHNCHDFTVEQLANAGLDLRRRWVYVAGGLAADLDAASNELESAGIRVIGP